jgi:hypothetical protein
MLECEEMKWPISSQETVLFNSLLDLSLSWGGLCAEYKKKDKTLDGKPASGIAELSVL